MLLLEIATARKYNFEQIEKAVEVGAYLESSFIFANFYDAKDSDSYESIKNFMAENFPDIDSERYHKLLNLFWEYIRGFADLTTEELDAEELHERISFYAPKAVQIYLKEI